VTRPAVIVGGLAAACVGTLLWCAWRIVGAGLPVGAAIASWALWAIVVAAAVTGVAFVREFLAHRLRVGARASARPLPALILLWVAGITAVGAFGFMLPNGSATAQPEREAGGRTATTQASTTAPATTAGARTTPTTPSRSASRSASATTTQPQVVSTSAPQRTTSTPSSATSSTSSSSSGTPTTTTSSTSTPIIDVTILPTGGQSTTPPGHR
jgi:hypothetical protein